MHPRSSLSGRGKGIDPPVNYRLQYIDLTAILRRPRCCRAHRCKRLLANHLRHRHSPHAPRLGQSIGTISASTLSALTACNRPCSIRELGNVIERWVILSGGAALELGGWLGLRPPHCHGEVSGGHPGTRSAGGRHMIEETERAGIARCSKRGRGGSAGRGGAAASRRPPRIAHERVGIGRPGWGEVAVSFIPSEAKGARGRSCPLHFVQGDSARELRRLMSPWLRRG